MTIALPFTAITAALLLLSCNGGAGGKGESSSGALLEVHRDRSTPPPAPLPARVARGANYASTHPGGGYGSEQSAHELDTLHLLGVDWIALSPFAFQPGAGADAIAGYDEASDSYVHRRGPSVDSALTREIAEAHRRSMHVLMKPHIWSHDFGNGEWHGTIRQSDSIAHRRWWRSYCAYILHYARLSERTGCEVFCLGVELERQTLEHPDEWRGLIRDVRQIYHGKLTYAAHWEREYWQLAFWDNLDIVGLNAYFPVPLGDEASAEEIATALAPRFDSAAALAQRLGRPLWFTEAGYRAERGTLREPWRENSGVYDPDLQARAIEGMMRAVDQQPGIVGVFLWKAFTSPEGARAAGEDSTFLFRDRPSEAVVRRWYAEHE